MFLFSTTDLVFVLSFAFLALIILIWILAILIAKKIKANKKKNINYAAKNIHEDTNEKIEEDATKDSSSEEENIENDSNNSDETIVESKEIEENIESTNDEISENNPEITNEEDASPIIIEETPVEEKEDSNIEKDNNEVQSNDLEEGSKDSSSDEENIESDNNEQINELEEIDNSLNEENNDLEENDEEPVEVVEPQEETSAEKSDLEEKIEIELANDSEEINNEEESNESNSITEEPKVEKKKINAVPVKKGRTYNGKFEIFEAGDGYAYQLKASNGEILVVSETYSSRDSTIKAIKAVQKNINDGEIKIFADKRGKYKFKLIAKNYKPLAISASYTVYKSAVRASESFKKYAMIADIVDIEFDDKESKTATPIEIEKTEDKSGAKFVIEKFDGEFSWALKASNGEILCQAEGYTSKAGCMYSIDTFKKNVEVGQFRCIKDKNGNYCYKLYTVNNRICAVGESYSSKQSAISAANSVVSFYKNAVIEEIK